MKTEQSKQPQYFVFKLGFRNRGRELAKIGDQFFELDDLSKHSGKPKKQAKPLTLEPFEQIKAVQQ